MRVLRLITVVTLNTVDKLRDTDIRLELMSKGYCDKWRRCNWDGSDVWWRCQMIGYHAACFIGVQTVQDLLVDQANAGLTTLMRQWRAQREHVSWCGEFLPWRCWKDFTDRPTCNVVQCFPDITITSLCCHADTARDLTWRINTIALAPRF